MLGRIFYSMTICDLKRGARAVVLKVEQPVAVRERLHSYGIFTGAKIVLLRVSMFKKTYLLQVGGTRVALERDIAAGIRVWNT